MEEIEQELFNRGLEVTLKYLYEDNYEIYPYEIQMELDLLQEPEVLDWIAATAKAMTDMGELWLI